MPKTVKVTQEDWLKKGVELFAESGMDGLWVEEMSRRLEVNKSEFFLHFNSKEEFLHQMFHFWQKEKTTRIVENLNRERVEKRLEKLVDLVFADRSLGDFLFFLRQLSQKDTKAARLLEEVEMARIDSTRYIFSGLGFSLKEIDLKVEVLYSFYLGWYERHKYSSFSPALRQQVLRQLHHLLHLDD